MRRSALAAPLLAASLLATGHLAACATAPERRAEPPALAFTDRPPVAFAAQQVAVLDDAGGRSSPGDVGSRFRLHPAQVLRNWAQGRLAATGSGGTLSFVIEEARVTEEVLDTKSGIAGYLTQEADRRFVGTLAGRLVYRGPGGTATARAEVGAGRPVPEDASANEAERIYYAVLEDLAEAFDAEMEPQIAEHFGLAMVKR